MGKIKNFVWFDSEIEVSENKLKFMAGEFDFLEQILINMDWVWIRDVGCPEGHSDLDVSGCIPAGEARAVTDMHVYSSKTLNCGNKLVLKV